MKFAEGWTVEDCGVLCNVIDGKDYWTTKHSKNGVVFFTRLRRDWREFSDGMIRALVDESAHAGIVAAGSVAVVYTEGYSGEWTCSGCGNDWCLEAEGPEENNMKFCPFCGGRIVKIDHLDDEEPEPEEEEVK
jgi:hypothetical protein